MYPDLQLLCSTVEEVERGSMHNLVASPLSAPVPPPRIDGIVAGFPCQDASALNIHSGSVANTNCVLDDSKRTGAVFNSIVRLMNKQKLSWAILENVTGLARKRKGSQISNCDVCVRLLQNAGFYVRVHRLDPGLFGRCTSRGRLFFVVVRMSIIDASPLTPADIGKGIDEALSLLLDRMTV